MPLISEHILDFIYPQVTIVNNGNIKERVMRTLAPGWKKKKTASTTLCCVAGREQVSTKSNLGTLAPLRHSNSNNSSPCPVAGEEGRTHQELRDSNPWLRLSNSTLPCHVAEEWAEADALLPSRSRYLCLDCCRGS